MTTYLTGCGRPGTEATASATGAIRLGTDATAPVPGATRPGIAVINSLAGGAKFAIDAATSDGVTTGTATGPATFPSVGSAEEGTFRRFARSEAPSPGVRPDPNRLLTEGIVDGRGPSVVCATVVALVGLWGALSTALDTPLSPFASLPWPASEAVSDVESLPWGSAEAIEPPPTHTKRPAESMQTPTA